MPVTDRNFDPNSHKGVDAIKESARAFAKVLRERCPEGRWLYIALAHLETASMYGVKSSVHGDDDK